MFYEADIEENRLSEEEIIEVSGSTSGADGGIRRLDSESSDDDNIPIAELRPSKYYFSKNRYKWATEPPSKRIRTPQHIIVLNRSIMHLTEDEAKDPINIWNKLFDDEMRQTIMIWTNFKIAELRAKYKQQDRSELKEMDMIELNAFLGLLYYSAVSKSNHESTSFICAKDGTGCEIFRCCMSETRFLVLLNCLRFDNPADRAERIKTDKFIAI